MKEDNEFNLWYEHDSVETSTSEDQLECEKDCFHYLYNNKSKGNKKSSKEQQDPLLTREAHINYLINGLSNDLPASFVSLDARYNLIFTTIQIYTLIQLN